jgi:hypothetical protein
MRPFARVAAVTIGYQGANTSSATGSGPAPREDRSDIGSTPYKKKPEFEQYGGLKRAVFDLAQGEELVRRFAGELLDLAPEQNRQEISRYIIRREMAAKVLGMIANERIAAPSPASRKGATARKPGLAREASFTIS